MTHPQPPVNPPHTACPPQPPIKERPSVTINNYHIALLIIAVFVINKTVYKIRSLSKIKSNEN